MRKAVLIFVSLLVSYYSFAQSSVLQEKITLNVQNKSLDETLAIIEQTLSVNFAYKTGVINKQRPISVSVVNMPLNDLLKIILYDDGAKFSVVGKQIILFQPQSQIAPNTTKPKPVLDTIWTQITNTTYVTDTNRITIYDTITVLDTILVRTITKEKTHLTRTKMPNFYSGTISSNYSNVKFDSYNNPNFILERGSQIQTDATVLVGKSSNNWEISSGLGFSLISHSIPFTNLQFFTQTNIDSVEHIDVTYDSTFITLPGFPNADTLWLVEQNTNRYIKVDTTIIHDTIFAHSKNSNTMWYMNIPIQVNYRKQFDRSKYFIASLGITTHFLIKDSYQPFTYLKQGIKKNIELQPTSVFVDTNIGAGIEYVLQHDVIVSCICNAGIRRSPMFLHQTLLQKNTLIVGISVGAKKYF